MSEIDMRSESNVADELLDELDRLESSADVMEEDVKKASEKHDEWMDSDSPGSVDAATISLESAKTAQQAAVQSQAAAEAAIKLAHEQKGQAMELADANVAWRQAVRNVNKDLESSKTTLTVMLVVVIVIALVSTSVMGFLFYSTHKKTEEMKNSVLDIVSTQSTLLNKQVNLKTDQMVSVVESIITTLQHKQSSAPAQSSMAAPESDKQTPAQPAKPEMQTPTASMPTDASTKAVIQAKTEEKMKPAVDQQTIRQSVKTEVSGLVASQQAQLARIEKLIEQLSSQQKALAAQKTVAPATKAAAPATPSAGLNAAELGKLNAIATRVDEQSKMIQSIQSAMKAQHSAYKTMGQSKWILKKIEKSLNRLSAQIKLLKEQQTHVTKEVGEIKKSTKKLTEEPKPYSYHVK
ncbi:MAG: hypothetical protein R3219_02435 [Hydrogenovibrio sp.]|nr:hypothetical protein [Hydrogenovibrio sp.]